MLEIKTVSKRYGKTQALHNFSCVLQTGIYGLLGPNGSGKTTLMNLLTDNLKKDSGTVEWNGQSLHGGGKALCGQIGYMPQYCEMIPGFSVMDFLGYMAALKDLDAKTATAQINELLERFFEEDVRRKKIASLSGGMKQRVMLIQAFLGEPSIVLLDEPTAGLDPIQRIAVKNFLAEKAAERTILFATHIISDVESIARQLLCLQKGTCIFNGSPEEFALCADGQVWAYRGIPGDETEISKIGRLLSARSEGDAVDYRILSSQKPFAAATPLAPTPEDAYVLLYGEAHETFLL